MRAFAVHGGAGRLPEKLRSEHDEGIRNALEAGRQILMQDGSAVESVIAAVAILEDLPAFNAGYGSALNSAGYVELDAGLMEGHFLGIGAVAAIRDVQSPIQVCRVILQQTQILFSGVDASRVAQEAGIKLVSPDSMISSRRLKQRQSGASIPDLDSGLADTVGAVALDGEDDMAAATSTGGTNNKPPGRIGDSPLPGCGYYADNNWGACSTTGWGEGLARILAARRIVEGLERGLSVSQSIRTVLDFLKERIRGGEGGAILLDCQGNFGAEFNSSSMTYAWWSERGGKGIVA